MSRAVLSWMLGPALGIRGTTVLEQDPTEGGGARANTVEVGNSADTRTRCYRAITACTPTLWATTGRASCDCLLSTLTHTT